MKLEVRIVNCNGQIAEIPTPMRNNAKAGPKNDIYVLLLGLHLIKIHTYTPAFQALLSAEHPDGERTEVRKHNMIGNGTGDNSNQTDVKFTGNTEPMNCQENLGLKMFKSKKQEK